MRSKPKGAEIGRIATFFSVVGKRPYTKAEKNGQRIKRVAQNPGNRLGIGLPRNTRGRETQNLSFGGKALHASPPYNGSLQPRAKGALMKPMRRSKQQLNEAACREILTRSRECVLALAGSDATDGFPYAVPVNYAVREDSDGTLHLLIHCAPVGAKLDAIAADPRVSVCVISQGDVVPEEFTTHFKSVVAFGRARLVEDGEARHAALRALAAKYCPGLPEESTEAEIARFPRTAIIDVTLEHVTGKQCIELL